MNNQEIELLTKKIISCIQKEQKSESNLTVPVGVSNRHIHLSEKDVETLFGEGHKLTKKKELMGGQFACEECCTIIGLKLRAIENVRILGPARKATQVEISKTDARKLGINVPVRESGDIKGSAPIAIVGPKGAIYCNEGCIIAARHIHMSPEDAKRFGVTDGQYVNVQVQGERGTTFNQVKIRVDDSFTLEMHIDTDEANASGIKQNDKVIIID